MPKRFTAERPALTFTHDTFLDISIHEHPTASRLHKPTDGPSIQAVSAEHPFFAARPDFPSTVDEMIRKGLPQLLLHITSFSDATLVALMWPHTLTDAFGVLALLRSWSLILANREDEVPPLLGAREDVILEAENSVDKGHAEPHKLEPMRLAGLAMYRWGLRHMWYRFWSPAQESRTIFLPKEIFSRIKSQIQQEIAELPAADGQVNFASEGDMLTAWVTHIVASSESTPSPMTVLAFFNLRARLSSVIKSEGMHVQNMLMLTYAFLSSQLLKGTVGSIAVAHRRQFQEQTTEQQVLSFLRTLRQDIYTTGSERYLFGETNSRPIIFNSFLKAEFIKAVDFSPAVLRQGDSPNHRSNPPGTMIVYYYHIFGSPLGWLTTFYMLGKDHNGNCWLQGNLQPGAWKEMQVRLDKISLS